MSRRARQRVDKRDMAFDLARLCGHGTPMPADDPERDDDPADWQDTPHPKDTRTPTGPLDVAAPHSHP